MFFKVALKVFKIIGLLCKKICTLELSKIAQSGHTAHTVRSTSAKHQKADFEPLRHCFDFQV